MPECIIIAPSQKTSFRPMRTTAAMVLFEADRNKPHDSTAWRFIYTEFDFTGPHRKQFAIRTALGLADTIYFADRLPGDEPIKLQAIFPRKLNLETCCVDSDAESITAMTDVGQQINYKTFAALTNWHSWAAAMGYGRGLTLQKDYHVTYWQSVFQGKPCIYAVHSAIEYVFT